jgi:hypothetical protein
MAGATGRAAASSPVVTVGIGSDRKVGNPGVETLVLLGVDGDSEEFTVKSFAFLRCSI